MFRAGLFYPVIILFIFRPRFSLKSTRSARRRRRPGATDNGYVIFSQRFSDNDCAYVFSRLSEDPSLVRVVFIKTTFRARAFIVVAIITSATHGLSVYGARGGVRGNRENEKTFDTCCVVHLYYPQFESVAKSPAQTASLPLRVKCV